MTRKQLLMLALIPLLAIAAIQPAFAASPFDNLGSSVAGALQSAWQWIMDNIIKPIVDGIKTYIIQPIMNMFGSFISVIGTAITQPFIMLTQSFQSSLDWFKQYLGPLAPVAFTLIIILVLVIIFYFVKWLLPGI
ncbi:MAG: hypothetical protein GXO43_09930 [Crenarchaeota archaeon]|nr:hypothetical protein [Thermoproteota archaeon]